jgi:hypothetical protein
MVEIVEELMVSLLIMNYAAGIAFLLNRLNGRIRTGRNSSPKMITQSNILHGNHRFRLKKTYSGERFG